MATSKAEVLKQLPGSAYTIGVTLNVPAIVVLKLLEQLKKDGVAACATSFSDFHSMWSRKRGKATATRKTAARKGTARVKR